MPSIQNVADQINTKLDQINTNTANTASAVSAIKNEVQMTNTRLNTIDNTLQSGFANLSQGLFILSELQKISIELLDHHRKQNDTKICEIRNTNELLCGITRKFTKQLRLSNRMAISIDRIEGITARVHAEQTAGYDRELELIKQMEECCPPEKLRPDPCPSKCDAPDFKAPKPENIDWEPISMHVGGRPRKSTGKRK